MISGKKIQETIKLSEDSEFLSFYEKVEKNNKDYEAWINVLKMTEEESLELARLVYKEFLEIFPFSPAYWQKWVQREIREHDIKSPETKALIVKIYEDAVAASPYSIELWIHYTNFASVHLSKDEGRAIFKRAVPLVGSCKTAHKLWDAYLAFEASTNNSLNVALVYKELLQTSFFYIDKYWEPFVVFSEKQPTELLGDSEEIQSIKEEYDQNEDHKMDSDIQRLSNIKQMLLSRRKSAFDASVGRAEKFQPFEESLKFTFDNRTPSENEIRLWNQYLDIKEKIDSKDQAGVLFERALIPLVYNAFIWTRYILWSYKNAGVEKAISICNRAIHYVPDNPAFYIYLCSYLEEQQRYDEVNAQLSKIQSLFTNYLESFIYQFEYFVRQNRVEEAVQLLTDHMNDQNTTLNDRAYICVYLAHYYVHKKNLEKAREIYKGQEISLSSSALYWRCYFQFESIYSTDPASALPSLLDSLLKSSLIYSQKLLIYERYLDYMTFLVPIQKLNLIKSEYYEFKQENKTEDDEENFSLKATVKRVSQAETETKKQQVETTSNATSPTPAPTPSTTMPLPSTTMPAPAQPMPTTMPSMQVSGQTQIPQATPYMNPYYYNYYYQQYSMYQYPPAPQQ